MNRQTIVKPVELPRQLRTKGMLRQYAIALLCNVGKKKGIKLQQTC